MNAVHTFYYVTVDRMQISGMCSPYFGTFYFTSTSLVCRRDICLHVTIKEAAPIDVVQDVERRTVERADQVDSFI